MSTHGTCDLLLTGGAVIPVDGERGVIEPGAVAISGDRIVAVDRVEEVDWAAKRTIDCTGKAVIPGLIDSHTHLWQGVVRSLGEGVPLWPWLAGLVWPFAALMEPADGAATALNGAIEAARSGTTFLLDHSYAPNDLDGVLAIADAVKSVGIRGAIARGIGGPPSGITKEHGLDGALFSNPLEQELAITKACIEARPPGSKVTVWPGPHNAVYASRDVMHGAVALAREMGTKWHTHLSTRQEDPLVYLETYGIRPVEWLYDEGLLGPEAVFAHGVHLDDREIECLGGKGSAVVYCPVSHQYGGCGTMRLRDLRNAGAVVGIGSDGPAYNHRQDLFECIKQAVLVQRQGYLDTTVMESEEALALATREAAKLVGIDAGVLAAGKLADVTVVDLDAPHMKPRFRTIATLAYSARASDVSMTIVGGQVVYDGEQCVLVDEEAAMQDVQARSASLIARAGLESWVHAGATP